MRRILYTALIVIGAVLVWIRSRGGEAAVPAVPESVEAVAAEAREAAVLVRDRAIAPELARAPAGASPSNGADEAVGGEAPADAPSIEELHGGDYDDDELLARIGLPAGAPVALLVGRLGPPDPLEQGNASVRITLFDVDGGGPVGSPVVLWRIDAPGNEYWRHGDQAVAREDVPRGGFTFSELAAGEYRAVCLAEKTGAQDPPGFFVSGDTETALFLTLPGERPVRAELFAGGVRVERATIRFHGTDSWHTNLFAPAWVKKRELRDPPDVLFDEEFESVEGSPFAAPWVAWVAGPDGFDLGFLPEDSRHVRHQMRFDFRTEAGATANLNVRNPGEGDVIRLRVDLKAP